MTEDDARRRLTLTPTLLRERLVPERNKLPFGALLAVGRFYRILHDRGEQPDAPSSATFELATTSKTGLDVLLRTLTRYAPDEVCLAEGRALLRSRYQERQQRKAALQGKLIEKPKPNYSGLPNDLRYAAWPEPWLALLPNLTTAPRSPATLRKDIWAINQCAQVARDLTCPPQFSWLFGWELASAFRKRGLANITISSYLASLITLGLHGGLPASQLAGLRSVQNTFHTKAASDAKKKTPRVQAFAARGGYAEVIATVVRLLERAEAEPDWSMRSERARLEAALLMVVVNVPPRTADSAAWRLGHEIVREPWGEWRLAWRQRKTQGMIDVGRLWPETGAVLDIHLLGGRAKRLVDARYRELHGLNWLRLRPGERGGSVRLNSVWVAAEWISALVTPPPGLASAG